MEEQRETAEKRTCPFCQFEFSSVGVKNRHVKTIHSQQNTSQPQKQDHIICPLCRENRMMCGTYNNLRKHLQVIHNINIEVTLNFFSKEECLNWLEVQRIETKYAMIRTSKSSGNKEKIFACNRSNGTGNKLNTNM